MPDFTRFSWAFRAPSGRRGWRVSHLALTVGLVLAGTGVASARSAPPPPPTFLFISNDDSGNHVHLVRRSAVTGDVYGDVAPQRITRGRSQLTIVSAAAGQGNTFWLTYAGTGACGPQGCVPGPLTCTGEIRTLDLATGRTRTVLRPAATVRVVGATPSPDGHLLAWLESDCSRSFLTQYVRVRDLRTGHSWTLGAGLPACHSLSSLSWASDGHTLLTTYGASPGHVGAHMGVNGCLSPLPAGLLQVDARTAQSGLTGRTLAPPGGCVYGAVAPASAGAVWAVRSCGRLSPGSPVGNGGPAALVHVDAAGQPTDGPRLSTCDNGHQLASNRALTDVIVVEGDFCSSAATVAGGPSPSRVRMWNWDGTVLHPLLDVHGGGQPVSSVAW